MSVREPRWLHCKAQSLDLPLKQVIPVCRDEQMSPSGNGVSLEQAEEAPYDRTVDGCLAHVVAQGGFDPGNLLFSRKGSPFNGDGSR